MPNPANLAPELFQMVLDYAIDGEDKVQSFCKFCLVSRQWNAIVSPVLYSEWTYDGDKHSFMSLWRFCRTMLQNAKIADSVRALDIGYWGHPSLILSDDGPRFPPEDPVIFDDAFSAAGMQDMQFEIDGAIRNKDRRPLMALLLTALPNLKSIHAHLPTEDPFLERVLALGLSDQSTGFFRTAFRQLEKAELMSEWNNPIGCFEDEDFDLEYVLNLEYLWPIFHLPNLRELSILDLDPQNASNYFKGCPGTSSITHLTLVYRNDCDGLASDVCSLIALPKTLISLAMFLENATFADHTEPISNEKLMLALEPHRESLECLDFYRQSEGDWESADREGILHFDSLHSFKRLTRLCIQPHTLPGDYYKDPCAPFRLKDILPPTLKSLIFYGDYGPNHLETLGTQISEVIESLDFAALSNIVLEDVCTRPFELLYQEVKRSCRKRNIKYQKAKDGWKPWSSKPSILPKGGSQLPCFRRAAKTRHQKEKQVHRKKERERVIYRRESREERRIRRSRRYDFVEPDDDEVDWMTSNSDLDDTTSEEVTPEEEGMDSTVSESTSSESSSEEASESSEE